jgi:tetratricopeptide (TPR) repeat protein
VNARVALADLYVQQSKLALARPLAEEVARLRPKDVVCALNLSMLLIQLKDQPAAIATLKRVLEIDPKQPQAMESLARLYLGSRKGLPEALALAQGLAEIKPDGVSYDLLGWASFSNQRTNEAIAAASMAVEKDPSNPTYKQRLKRLREVTGRPE